MSIQLMAVLLQIANLCFMLSLYGNSVMQGTSITPEARVFQFWVLVEIIVMMCTIFNSMFYLLFRSIKRDAQFYPVVEVTDTTQDFMSSPIKIVQLTVVLSALGPTLTNTVLWFAPFLQNDISLIDADTYPTSDTSLEILKQ